MPLTLKVAAGRIKIWIICLSNHNKGLRTKLTYPDKTNVTAVTATSKDERGSYAI